MRPAEFGTKVCGRRFAPSAHRVIPQQTRITANPQHVSQAMDTRRWLPDPFERLHIDVYVR